MPLLLQYAMRQTHYLIIKNEHKISRTYLNRIRIGITSCNVILINSIETIRDWILIWYTSKPFSFCVHRRKRYFRNTRIKAHYTRAFFFFFLMRIISRALKRSRSFPTVVYLRARVYGHCSFDRVHRVSARPSVAFRFPRENATEEKRFFAIPPRDGSYTPTSPRSSRRVVYTSNH